MTTFLRIMADKSNANDLLASCMALRTAQKDPRLFEVDPETFLVVPGATAAPLSPLFRHRTWQKLLKETWNKLEKGDYDWAHLAMAYWPARVRKKCETDRSLAIAHGLEDRYQPPLEDEKRPARRRSRNRAAEMS